MTKVYYYGMKTNFIGKTLFGILGNLRNFGVNRMLHSIKQEELLSNPGKKVEPVMDKDLKEGAIKNTYRTYYDKAVNTYQEIIQGKTPLKSELLDTDLDKVIGEEFLKLSLEEREDGTYVDAKPISTGRENILISKKSGDSCVLCSLNLRNLNYTDVLILSQFIKKDGSLATYHESKLCSKQYRKVMKLIQQAQRCNLIERPPDYLVPGPWHDLNTYIEPDRRRDQPMKIINKAYWNV